jgi:predicted dehydrogenase
MSQISRRLRVGIIGCGNVARLHAERLVSDERVELAVCFDPYMPAAQAWREQFAPQAAIAADAIDTVRNHRLDAVVLCSPTLNHYEQAREALDLGVHVLCEKPLVPERWQVLDLIERQRKHSCILSIGYQRRYMAPYVTARRELVQQAAWYGPVKQIHLFVCEHWQQVIAGTWRDDPAMGAGYFGDAGIHQVDVASFITGLHVERVFAVSDRRDSRVEVVTQVLAQLTGGAGMVAHFVGDANHWREDIHFHCAHADLLLRNEELYRARDSRTERVLNLEPADSPDHAFVDAILTGQPTVSPPEIALPVHDWTQAVLQSAREGRWVELPQR